MFYFKANMCLHCSCADWTANLKWYLHASRALGGHPVHTILLWIPRARRCTYINNIKNVNRWKSKIYFYKRHRLHCSSWEQKNAVKDIAHESKKVLNVLRFVSCRSNSFFLPLPWKNWSVACVAWGKHTASLAEIWAISISLNIWLQMEPAPKNKKEKHTTSAGLLVMDASHQNWWSNEY